MNDDEEQGTLAVLNTPQVVGDVEVDEPHHQGQEDRLSQLALQQSVRQLASQSCCCSCCSGGPKVRWGV